MRMISAASSAAVVAALSVLHAIPAHADLAGIRSFSIPPQSLSAALIQFSTQADVQVVGSTETLANLDTTGVSGALTGREALQRLLARHALRFEEVTSRSVKILPLAPSTGRASDSAAAKLVLSQGNVGADAQSAAEPAAAAEPDAEEVVVTGKRFNYETVESANRMPLSVKDTPQSVKIITEDMMDFAGITEFEDTYKIDANSHASHLRDGFARNYFRGFLADSSNAFRLDGMRAFGVIELDLAPLERIEIVKGSTSTMFGSGSIGGTLNAISKKPMRERGGSVYLEGGTYNHIRGGLDVHGALNSSEQFTGRLVASYLDEEGPVDFYYNKIAVIAPSLKYEFTPDTSLTLLSQYQDQDFMPLGNFGIQIAGDRLDPAAYRVPDVPRSRLAGQPDQYRKSKLYYGRLLFEHRFAQDWQLRTNVQYAKLDNDSNQSQGVVTYADGLTDIEIFGEDRQNDLSSFEANVFGDFTLGGREHTAFFGADWYHSKDKGYAGYAWVGNYMTGFSIFDPDYSLLPRTFRNLRSYSLDNPGLAPFSDYAETTASAAVSTEIGYTGQLLLRPTDKLHVVLGARYAEFEDGRVLLGYDLSVFDSPLPPKEYYRNYAVTYQAGVTYAINDRVNAYASYGQTFQPRNDATYDPDLPQGRPVGPEEGEAYEIGLKGDVSGGKFSWSAALFQIARTNITETDQAHQDFVRLLGEQRSRGLELDAQGEIRQGWSVYGTAAVTDNEFVKGEFDGFPSYFAPKFGVSVYSSYELQGGALPGLGFGGGVVYKDVVNAKPFFGPVVGRALHLFDDVLEVDARAFYRKDNWYYELAITNLLDEKYYSPSYPSPYYAINVNPGRQFIGSVKYKF